VTATVLHNKTNHSAHYNLDGVKDEHVKRVVEKQREIAKIVRKLAASRK
jgi:hypothetical protein